MQHSPFSDRMMITDPSRFFGRVAETQRIFNALASSTPQNVSIIGERRIGRSSLLQHILRSYRQQLPQPDSYRFAYLDLARDSCVHPHQFYAELVQAFGGNEGNRLSPQRFDDWLIRQNQPHKTYHVLLLDEFNVLQKRREQFGDDFYDGLRSRANAGEITLVLATHLPLNKIALDNGFTSTFFGIFTPVDLLGLSYDEAKESVLRPAQKPLRHEDFDALRLWTREPEQEKYHPLKVNIAANHIWQALPNPNYEQLEKAYRKTVAHVFGEQVRQARQKEERRESLSQGWDDLKETIHWWTGEKPYLILFALLVVILLLAGLINGDQFWAWVQQGVGIPTVTPVPTVTP